MGFGTPSEWWYLVFLGLTFTYEIFLLIYLNATKKYAKDMNERDRHFRSVAVVITWISLILTGLVIAAIGINMITGTSGNMILY